MADAWFIAREDQYFSNHGWIPAMTHALRFSNEAEAKEQLETYRRLNPPLVRAARVEHRNWNETIPGYPDVVTAPVLPVSEPDDTANADEFELAQDRDAQEAAPTRRPGRRKSPNAKAYVSEKRRDALAALLTSPEGRDLFWHMLAQCGVFQPVTVNDPLAVMRAEGRREIGIWLMQRMADADPAAWPKMILEHGNFDD